MSSEVLLRQETADCVNLLQVTGAIAPQDTPHIVRAVEDAMERQPRGVVIDLRDVTAVSPDVAVALIDLAEHRAGWPRASLSLFGAAPDVERALAGLVVHPTRGEALDHVDDRRAGTCELAVIEHSHHGPAQARRLVLSCAARLGLTDEVDDLVLLASEMVTNAVRHGAPPVQLELVTDTDTVVLAVADASVQPPQARHADEEAEGGRGMALVDLLTDEHGVRPYPTGKIVWAALRRRGAARS